MKEFLLAMLITVVVLAIIFIPLAFIWAINILFQLTIPYTLKTWAASLIISSLLSARVAASTK